MKVVFVNTAIPVVPLFADSFPLLVKRGIEPVAMVSEAAYREGDDSKLDSSFLRRLPCPGFARSRKIFRHFFFALRVPAALKKEQPGLVVFLTQPPLFHSLASRWCRKRGIPYVVHVMDQYPEVLSSLGKLRKTSVVFRRMQSGVRKSYDGARAIISLGECMTRMLRDHYEVDERKIHELPNWSHTLEKPQRVEENEFLSGKDWGSDFVVLYSGNLGAGHDVSTIEGILQKCSDDERLRFVFIGGGSGHTRLKEAWKTKSRVHFLPFQPKSRLGQTLTAASIHLISLKEDFRGLMVPSKLYGCLASGRPILSIGPTDSTVAETITKAQCGAVVANSDVETAVAALQLRVENPDRVRQEGANAERWHDQNGGQNAAERYSEAIVSLATQNCEMA